MDRSYVLASKYFDRHTSYVALSRHREAATIFYSRDEFTNPRGQDAAPDPGEAKRNLEYTLARERWKEYHQGQDADRGRAGQEKSNTQGQDRSQGKDDDQYSL